MLRRFAASPSTSWSRAGIGGGHDAGSLASARGAQGLPREVDRGQARATMNTTVDPYASPHARDTSFPASGGQAVSPRVLEALRKTRPWVTLIAVLGFVVVAFMLIGSLVIMAVGIADISPAFAAVYGLMAVLYAFPSMYLFRYGRSIKALITGGGDEALGQALEQQMLFWRLLGVSAALLLGLYLVGLLGAVLFAVIGAFGS